MTPLITHWSYIFLAVTHQVIVWCFLATSDNNNLKQCWLRPLTCYYIIRKHWVKSSRPQVFSGACRQPQYITYSQNSVLLFSLYFIPFIISLISKPKKVLCTCLHNLWKWSNNSGLVMQMLQVNCKVHPQCLPADSVFLAWWHACNEISVFGSTSLLLEWQEARTGPRGLNYWERAACFTLHKMATIL